MYVLLFLCQNEHLKLKVTRRIRMYVRVYNILTFAHFMMMHVVFIGCVICLYVRFSGGLYVMHIL